jgi:hypothetical protein
VKPDLVGSISEQEAVKMLENKKTRQPTTSRAAAAVVSSEQKKKRNSFTGPTTPGTTSNGTPKLTGYQVFVKRAIKDRGLTLKEVSMEWKALTDAEKAAYNTDDDEV